MQTVLLTPTFERQAARAGLSDDEILEIAAWLGRNPQSGKVFAAPGGGKSGGYRTIHYFAGDDVPVFLLAVYAKGEKGNLSKSERNEIATVLPRIGDSYRADIKARIVTLRRPI